MQTLPTFDLVVINGAHAGERRTLTAAGITVGRQADNTLAIEDQELSRHHARVELQNGRPTITDLGSANGTRVNGQPLAGSRVLQLNDTIALGSTEIRVEWARERRQPAPAAPNPPGATVVAPGTHTPPPIPTGPGDGQPQPYMSPQITPTTGTGGRSRLPLFLAGGAGILLLCCVGAFALALLLASRGGNTSASNGGSSGGGSSSGGIGGGGSAGGTGGQAAAKAGYISGRVTDVQGKAVPSGVATIIMRGVTQAGSNVDIRAQSDASGNYSQKVANGQYRLSAFLEVTLSGKKYSFELAPADDVADTNYDSTNGVVKNFQWRMSGKRPGTSDSGDPYFDCPNYYGGCAYFEHVNSLEGGNALAAKYPGSQVELTLSPRGPLYDGSVGKVVTLSRDPQGQLYGRPALVLDIPLGSYTVTARVVEANGTAHPLRVALGGKNTPTLGPSANLDFAPRSSYGTDNASIVLGE